MTRDPRSTGDERSNDAAIGDLVREVAEAWSMPPVRLDAPGWRERIRRPGARRAERLAGWLRPARRAGTAAVALTVAAALVAVVLTRPPTQVASSPGPSGAASPGPSVGATPLPKLLVNGETPEPASVVVQLGDGDFAQVDLETGVRTGGLTGADFHSVMQRMPGGSLVCLCLVESDNVDAMPTKDAVRLDRFDAAGELVSSTPIETFIGEVDPRDVGSFVPEQPPHVFTWLGFEGGGRYGYVGWSRRAPPVWKSGLIVVDLADGSVVSQVDLPDVSTGEGDARTVVDAPRVVSERGQGRVFSLIVGRPWFSWNPVTHHFDSDAFEVSMLPGGFDEPKALPGAPGCGELIVRAGPTAGGGSWLACVRLGPRYIVRLLGPEGAVLDDVSVPVGDSIEGDMVVATPDGSLVYVWNARTTELTRIDVATAKTTTVQGSAATSSARSPITAFGDWLAPAAAAKSFLRGAVVLSADGTRIYAIGVSGGESGPEFGGSTGVYVFDTKAMTLIDHWPPTADYASLALSGDGRFLYAAGLPGVDAAGIRKPLQAASVTVFDTSDGTVRLIAGKLGGEMLSFTSTRLIW